MFVWPNFKLYTMQTHNFVFTKHDKNCRRSGCRYDVKAFLHLRKRNLKWKNCISKLCTDSITLNSYFPVSGILSIAYRNPAIVQWANVILLLFTCSTFVHYTVYDAENQKDANKIIDLSQDRRIRNERLSLKQGKPNCAKYI